MYSGTVYLIHFDPPFKHAQHYLGWTGDEEGVEARMTRHALGRGAVLVRHALDAGCSGVVVKTWPGTIWTERRMKGRSLRPLCPICTPRPREPLTDDEARALEHRKRRGRWSR